MILGSLAGLIGGNLWNRLVGLNWKLAGGSAEVPRGICYRITALLRRLLRMSPRS